MQLTEPLKEALNSEWSVPGYDRQKISATSTNRIESLAIFQLFIEGAFANNRILSDASIVSQLNSFDPPLLIGHKLLNRLYCLDLFYEQLIKHGYLDSDVMKLLYSLRPIIMRSILRSDSFLANTRHPLRKILDDICSWGAGWDKNLGKGGERYFSLLKNLAYSAELISDDNQVIPDFYKTYINGLDELALKYQQVETRLCESNKAQLGSIKIKRLVDQSINAAMEKRLLPQPAIKFLHGVWRDVLYRTMAAHGDASDDWRSANELMKKLIFCLSPDYKTERQKQLQIIPTLFPTLEKFLDNCGDLDDKEASFDALRELLQKTLMDDNIPAEVAGSLSSLDVDGVAVSISSALSQQVTQLKPGQWILYTTAQGETSRARLAMVSEEAGQLLFVNLLGVKPFSKNMEEMGFALAARKAHAIISTNLSNILLNITIELLTTQHQKQVKLSEESADPTRELRRQSGQKALAEAKKLHAERNAAITENANNNTAKPLTSSESVSTKQLHEDERPRIESLINTIEIGSWISMKNRHGETINCKVAIVYARTGKMVIVDKLGMRIGEYMRSELVQLIMDGEANILELSDSFEASLSRVLKTLRKDP